MDVDRSGGEPRGQERRALGRRAPQVGEEKRITRVCCGGIVIVFGGRPMMGLAADFFAEIGRVDGDRHQRVDGAMGGHQPRQRARRKAALEHLCRPAGTRCGGRRPQHHCNQPLVAAGRARHHIIAGSADEAGLHPVGAGIGIEQPVGVVHDALAELDRPDLPIAVIFREFANQGPCQDGEIAGGGDLLVGGQAVGIDVVRLGHAQAPRIGVHLVGELLDGTGNAFRQHHRHIVRRMHQHHLQGVVDGDLGADLEPHLGGLLGRRIGSIGEHGVGRNPLLA